MCIILSQFHKNYRLGNNSTNGSLFFYNKSYILLHNRLIGRIQKFHPRN